ncbi:hypothetical protein F5B20DRAFT_521391 [Whalleya microplaca]|nr:hypothetical protein F5B20DRAFT_521391 [Whalleya microplaca]
MTDLHSSRSGATHTLVSTPDESAPMKCCCGSVECVFLRHNYSVLDNVEKDVHTAARMGQALLARHEAYMADAERDRHELTTRIEQLETDNKELEARNAKTIEENRNLLDQLEALNTTVADSEGRIKSLEATLLSSQQTIRRLEGETARAESLERQLLSLEQEQAELQSHLSSSREEARSAVWRWKRAERGINDLQEQLERMEKEAKEEREHHVEMMGRIEKQREMERELNTAAGRLKGAAATKSLNHGNGGSNVVSHFVRDLLQDNANLQRGIAELREMLMNSNDEIQALQDQLAYHQPLGDGDGATTPTLQAELGPEEPPEDSSAKVSQELHIHHHYHIPPIKQEAKRPKKKRLGLTPGVFIPPGSSVPNTPPNTIVQQHPESRRQRDSLLSNGWSVYSGQSSEFAPSSAPSSPRSNRRSSLFDRTMDSFPGSPTTSVDPMSPTWRAAHRKQPSNMSSRSFQFPTALSIAPTTPAHAHPIMEEPDENETQMLLDLTSGTEGSTGDDETSSRDQMGAHDESATELSDMYDDRSPPGRLHRSMSHESIISLSGGLDIHTLRSRPSQLTIRHLNAVGASTSVTGSSTVTARPMLSRNHAKRSSVILRESYNSYSTSPADSLRSVSNSSTQSGVSKLGKLAIWRPWGGGNGGGGSASSVSSSSTRTVKEKDVPKTATRPPGVNQRGAIPGFSDFLAAAQRRTPDAKTDTEEVDRDALTEGLGE